MGGWERQVGEDSWIGWGCRGGKKTLISVELVAKVEEEACRLARKTAGGGKSKVGGD